MNSLTIRFVERDKKWSLTISLDGVARYSLTDLDECQARKLLMEGGRCFFPEFFLAGLLEANPGACRG